MVQTLCCLYNFYRTVCSFMFCFRLYFFNRVAVLLNADYHLEGYTSFIAHCVSHCNLSKDLLISFGTFHSIRNRA
jgi:hypothetical protein